MRRGASLAALAALVAVVGITLAACATPTDIVSAATVPSQSAPATVSPTASPSPSATPSVLGVEEVSGSGSEVGWDDPIRLRVPQGTRSVLIDLTCDGQTGFTAELGDAMALGQSPLGGTCDGSRRLVWPWGAGSSPRLSLTVADGVDWTASVTYSSEPFVEDVALTEECDRYARLASEVTNADAGYGYYAAFGADEWNTRIDTASSGIMRLAEESATELADDFATMATLLAERSPIPGGMTEVEEYWTVEQPIREACSWNHSELITYAEFGG